MEILYKADDGTIFEDEYECIHYEDALKYEDVTDVIFADINGKIFCLSEALKDDKFDRCYFIYAKNYEAWAIANDAIINKIGLEFPEWGMEDKSTSRCWYWMNGYCDGWVDFNEQYKSFEERKNIFRTMELMVLDAY